MVDEMLTQLIQRHSPSWREYPNWLIPVVERSVYASLNSRGRYPEGAVCVSGPTPLNSTDTNPCVAFNMSPLVPERVNIEVQCEGFRSQCVTFHISV